MDLRDCMDHLERCGACDVPGWLRQAIVGAGRAATPQLLTLFDHPDHQADRVSAHAVELIGAIGDPDALPHLVDLLCEEDGDLDMYAHDALVRYGPSAIDVLLAVVWWDPEQYAPVLVACGAGADDARVRHVVGRLLRQDPALGADCARLLGDAALVPDLVTALEQAAQTDPASWDPLATMALSAAIQRFGVDPGLMVALCPPCSVRDGRRLLPSVEHLMGVLGAWPRREDGD